MYDVPGFMWALLLLGVIGIPASTSVLLYGGAVTAGLGRRTAAAVTGGSAAVFGGWLVVASLLAAGGVYDRGGPWIGLSFAAALVALLAATRIPVISRVLADPGTPMRLTMPHALRVFPGVVFIILMAQGELPAIWAVPAGLGDIAVGVAAPFVARGLARSTGRLRAVWFNLLGIVDFIAALSIGLLASPDPDLGLLAVTPTTAPFGWLPLALIPTAAVPVAFALHVVSLRRLRPSVRAEHDRAGHLLPAG